MNRFQWITLSFLLLLLFRETACLFAVRGSRGIVLLRAAVWLAALVTVFRPQLASQVANVVEIQRGADLVLYMLTFAFMAATFFLCSRYTRLRCHLVELMRHITMLEARRGFGNNGAGGNGTGGHEHVIRN